MINRRSTPSGDGRGRGRGGAPGGASGSRGGAGFRGGSGGPRGGSRGGAQGGSGGGFRGGERRDGIFPEGRRGGADGGRGRSDDRDQRPRDDSRAREGFRGGYRDSGPAQGPSRARYGRPGDDRGSYGNDRRAPAGDDRRAPARDDRGSFGDDRRAPARGSYGDDRRAPARGSYGDDRRAPARGSFGDDRRAPARGDRGGSYADRRGQHGDDRRGGSYRDDRGDRGSYGGDRRGPARDDRGGSSTRDDRGGSYARGDRGGSYGGERRPSFRDDDRGGFRAGRTGSREPYGRDETGRDRPVRGGRPADDPRSGSRGGYGRDDRRDEVQTIGDLGGGSRGRYGRPEQGRPQDRFGRGGSAAGRGKATRDGTPAGRGKPPRGGAPAGRGPAARPERGAAAFKTARQPLRDPEHFPAGYTDERDTTEVPDGVRLQKVLAQAGVAARRTCEEMIGEGRVTVDGQVVRRFGARVDPAKQIIHVDGKRIPTAPDLVYFAINKPIGVVSTMSDPEGRPSLSDYVAERTERLFHVGRLDTETEGLIILTNDGELAHRLTHPSFGVQKKYWAKVPGPIPRDLPRRLKKGVELEDGLVKADDFKIVQEHGQQALVEIVLHEGRKHVVRRMLEQEGHNVIDLARIEFGPVKLGRLKPGTMRSLTLKEVGDLYAVVGM
ncbi:pseudouridine synthase [Sphaerisporangium perillae]|uniref:pseudouridine synthase n=1 Tax=Sphaerisporangium perillae TaxID=2935860 RepID=UPI0020106BB8|nr:pseudouridine synthase [Sphaerisporangium perillae]